MKKKRFITAITIAILLFSIFKIGKTFAATTVFSITNVEIANKTETTNVNDLSFKDSKINSDVDFHKVGDSITYKVTVKNNKNEKYLIKSVEIKSTNEYVTYELDNYSNIEMDANQEKVFNVTATYINEVTDMYIRNQDCLVDVIVHMENSTGETTDQNFTINSSIFSKYLNPRTGDSVQLYVLTALASIIVLVIISKNKRTLRKNSRRNRAKFFSILLAIAIVAPTISKAENDGSKAFSFESTIRLKDKLLVTYNVDGETSDVKVNYEETYTITGTPIKEGHTFDGWYTEPEEGEKQEGDVEIKDDTVLYAHFTEEEQEAEKELFYLIIEDEEFVETETPTGQYYSGKEIKLKAKDREGYVFKKWSNGLTDKEITFTLNEKTTIKPEYENKDCTITFDSKGGTEVESIEREYDKLIGELPSPTKDSLVFAGWYTDENYTEKINKNTIVTGDKTYYAKWVERMVTVFSLQDEVTFNGKDGYVSCDSTNEYDDQKCINTGVKLFDEANYLRDFEIEFEIVEFDFKNQDSGVDQQTFVNAKYEYQSWNYPGIVFRKTSGNSTFEIGCRATRSGNGALVKFNPNNTKKFIISRENNILYIESFDNNGNSTKQKVQDLNVLKDRFDTPVTFGASLDQNGNTFRWVKGKMKNLKIKVAYTAEDYVD